jgi:hypothetical protein
MKNGHKTGKGVKVKAKKGVKQTGVKQNATVQYIPVYEEKV